MTDRPTPAHSPTFIPTDVRFQTGDPDLSSPAPAGVQRRFYSFRMGAETFARWATANPEVQRLASQQVEPHSKTDPQLVITNDNPQFQAFVDALTQGRSISVTTTRTGKDSGGPERLVVTTMTLAQ